MKDEIRSSNLGGLIPALSSEPSMERIPEPRFSQTVRVSPHRFRHHFSHAWLDHGGAEGDLMELNGWTSPQMLRRYGASARSARARRSYDRVMHGVP